LAGQIELQSCVESKAETVLVCAGYRCADRRQQFELTLDLLPPTGFDDQLRW
jgi:hypothetical protein